MWERLRNRQLEGSKWGRQRMMYGFIADFYCPGSALVVELDGAYHEPSKDALRDRVLASHGITTLRFPNRLVETNIEGVLSAITGSLS